MKRINSELMLVMLANNYPVYIEELDVEAHIKLKKMRDKGKAILSGSRVFASDSFLKKYNCIKSKIK